MQSESRFNMGRMYDIEIDGRSGAASLAIASLIACLVFYAWWLWQEPPPQPAPRRDLTQVTFEWRCANGHVHFAMGATGKAQPCPECNADSHITQKYRCEKHGESEVLLLYEKQDSGTPYLAAYSVNGELWLPFEDAPPCLECGEPMKPVLPHPFTTSRKDREAARKQQDR